MFTRKKGYIAAIIKSHCWLSISIKVLLFVYEGFNGIALK